MQSEPEVGQSYITSYGAILTIISNDSNYVFYKSGTIYTDNPITQEGSMQTYVFKGLLEEGTLIKDTPAARLLFLNI